MTPSMVPAATALPALEVIRHKETEVKRRLAAEREAAQAARAEAEREARNIIAAADLEGQRTGDEERKMARAAAEREAAELIAHAHAAADLLLQQGAARLPDAITQAINFIVG